MVCLIIWMFSLFCLIILDVQRVSFNYFGCSVGFVELFWVFSVFC